MKKFNLSLVTVLAMSTFALAGGDIAPVEPAVEYVEPVAEVGGFYIGGAYGWQNSTIDVNNPTVGDTGLDENFGSIMIDAGYKFNPYIAVEGRYWFGLSSSNTLGWTSDIPSDVTIDSWGIYVKPMYPVTDAMNVYALLGYGSTDVTFDDLPLSGSYTSDSLDGFSWGIGADYAFSDNWAVFIDYTSITNDVDFSGPFSTIDNLNGSVDNINVGVNYTF